MMYSVVKKVDQVVVITLSIIAWF